MLVDPGDQPVVGSTVLGGEDVELRRFTNYVPIPETCGDLEEMPLLAGQGVGLVRDVRPAAEIVETMMAGAARILTGLAGRTGSSDGTGRADHADRASREVAR